MSEEKSRLLRENALLFFGTITAGLSHEINNSVAIVAELSGLMEDLLLCAEAGDSIDTAKLKELSRKINNQINRGRDIVGRLNRFAHSADEPVKEFDLKELLEEIVALAERFAFLEGIRLETDLADKSLMITGDLFQLQQAVFICLRLAVAASEKDDVITITFDEDASGAGIKVASAPADRAEGFDSEMSFLSALMKNFGGKAEVIYPDNGRQSLLLSVPKSMSGG